MALLLEIFQKSNTADVIADDFQICGVAAQSNRLDLNRISRNYK